VALPKGDIADRGLRYLIMAGFAGIFFISAIIVLVFTGASLPLGTLIVATIASVLPVPMYAALILWLDRHEKEPALALLSAFFWGALVAVAFAAIFNMVGAIIINAVMGRNAAAILTPSLVAPVVEETAKGMALVLLFFLLRHEFNNVVDGIVYGALVGLGFAMTENILYLGRAYVQGGLAAMTALFFIRVIMIGFMHSLWTGCTGAALGYAREIAPGPRRIMIPVAGYLCAMALHAMWNSSSIITAILAHVVGIQLNALAMIFLVIPASIVILLLPGIVVLIALAAAGWKREIRIIQEQLGEEVQRGGVVTAEELRVLTNWRERLRRLMGALQKGPAAWFALRQLYELQVDLAFRKWHAARGERLMSFQQVMTEDDYRTRIAAVRARLEGLSVASA
jgi:RsiW-degrading membrane proteinase PrsW (M82 family)